MKPLDQFYFLANNGVNPDFVSLSRCYQPIIGLRGLGLYTYLVAFYDDGHNPHKFSQILNHLNFGMPQFLGALDLLTSMDLVSIYKVEDHYVIELLTPMSLVQFMEHQVYRALLTKKIGESAIETMMVVRPAQRKDVGKVFSEVFDQTGQIQIKKPIKNDFDLVNFKKVMAKDRLRFKDEQVEILALINLSQQSGLNWYDLYQIARETAVDQVISISRMTNKLHSKKSRDNKSGTVFSREEKIIIKESKSQQPLVFLAEIKQVRKATVLASERALLINMAELGLLDEVINIILLYTFNKTKSANLNEKFAMKVANDFSFKEIITAEQAVLALRERGENHKSRQGNQSKKLQSNVPDWSNPDYKETLSPDQQADFEAKKREMLEQLRGGDN